jgi:hypothetical protein
MASVPFKYASEDGGRAIFMSNGPFPCRLASPKSMLTAHGAAP